MRVLIYSISSQDLPVVVPGAVAVGLVEEDGLPGLLADVPVGVIEEVGLPGLLADVPAAFDDDDPSVLNIVP
jgi:hypothetical protein